MLTLELRNSLHPIFELEALAPLSPKWTLRVAYALRGRVLRFHALQSELEDISSKMLASSLKVLVESGLVERRQYETIPPPRRLLAYRDGRGANCAARSGRRRDDRSSSSTPG